MASPFPGMDPFMEEPAIWPSVHNRLIIYLADTLNLLVPERYVANIEERVVLAEPPTARYPDVHVVKQRRKKSRVGSGRAGVAVLEPDPSLKIEHEPAEVRESFIEIHRAKKPNSLVAVLEILSPTNKRAGDGREKYLEKQAETMDRPTHLIEIDLLRAGKHTAAVPRAWLPEDGWDYLVCLCRAEWKNKFECWPTALPERLPRFSGPLANGDADVVIDLQALLTQCYNAGKFAQKVDYRGECPPPLSKKNAKWVDELLRKKKLRK